MNMVLNWFFGLISGEMGINWLSIRYSRYKTSLQDERNKDYMSKTDDLLFECPGAGHLAISHEATHMTGNAHGFGIGVSWGRYGFCGGVIGRSEARRLALHILNECDRADIRGTEQQMIDDFYKRLVGK